MKKAIVTAAFIYGCASAVGSGTALLLLALSPDRTMTWLASLGHVAQRIIWSFLFAHLVMFAVTRLNWGATGWPPVVQCTPRRAWMARALFVPTLAFAVLVSVAKFVGFGSDVLELAGLLAWLLAFSMFMILQWGLHMGNVFGPRFARRWYQSNATLAELAKREAEEKDRAKPAP